MNTRGKTLDRLNKGALGLLSWLFSIDCFYYPPSFMKREQFAEI